jgi:hypothetical protein
MERYGKIMESVFKWVDTDGQKYGIQMGKRR